MEADAERCEVLFPYKAVNTDELDLLPGQVVTVVAKQLEDPGWWKGTLDGRTGVFPDNFVRLLRANQRPLNVTSANSGARAKPVQKSGSIEEKYDLNSLKQELSGPSEDKKDKVRVSTSLRKTLRKAAAPSAPKIDVTPPLRSSSPKPSRSPFPFPGLVTKSGDGAGAGDKKEMGESPVLSKQDTFDELVTSEKLPQTTSLRARPPNRRPQSRELRLQNIPDEVAPPLAEDDEDAEAASPPVRASVSSPAPAMKMASVPGSASPVMPFKMPGMMDIKGVKLRGTKSPPGNTKNHISAEDGPGQPAWKEDLKKNRGSVGLFLEKSLGNEKDESSGMPAASSMLTKSQSERRPDHLKLENTSPRRVNTVHGPSAATRSEQDRERSDTTTLRESLADLRNDVKEQLSQLRKELEREKSERLNLEKEVEALRRKLDG